MFGFAERFGEARVFRKLDQLLNPMEPTRHSSLQRKFLTRITRFIPVLEVARSNTNFRKSPKTSFYHFQDPKICKKHIYCCFEILTNQGPKLTLNT